MTERTPSSKRIADVVDNVTREDRDALANLKERAALLRREGTYSKVWFADQLLKAADDLDELHTRLSPAPEGVDARVGKAGGALIWTFTAEAFADGTVNCDWHDVPGSEIHWDVSREAKGWVKSQVDEMVNNPGRCPHAPPSQATHSLIGQRTEADKPSTAAVALFAAECRAGGLSLIAEHLEERTEINPVERAALRAVEQALSRPPAEQVRMREIEPANPAHAAVLNDLAQRIDDE